MLYRKENHTFHNVPNKMGNPSISLQAWDDPHQEGTGEAMLVKVPWMSDLPPFAHNAKHPSKERTLFWLKVKGTPSIMAARITVYSSSIRSWLGRSERRDLGLKANQLSSSKPPSSNCLLLINSQSPKPHHPHKQQVRTKGSNRWGHISHSIMRVLPPTIKTAAQWESISFQGRKHMNSPTEWWSTTSSPLYPNQPESYDTWAMATMWLKVKGLRCGVQGHCWRSLGEEITRRAINGKDRQAGWQTERHTDRWQGHGSGCGTR